MVRHSTSSHPPCRIRQSRWSGAGPRGGLCVSCVARCGLSPTWTSRGSTPPSEGPCEGGTPAASEHSGFTKPAARTRPCALLVLSVTAGNWLSQHGGRSSTGRETVLPRRQKPYPPCVLSSPRGEVALPSHRARQPHSARQSSVASSARRRAPSADGAFFFGDRRQSALYTEPPHSIRWSCACL